jgi:hypothetical protein
MHCKVILLSNISVSYIRFIICCCSYSGYNILLEYKTRLLGVKKNNREMWESLTKLYQSDNQSRKMMLREKLRSTKMAGERL